ncbi:hypothetical protein D3C84_625130 [compost metagenome]
MTGHAQGEVGGGEQQVVGDEAQHRRQDSRHQAGGERRGQHPQHEQQWQGGGGQPVGETPGGGRGDAHDQQGQQALSNILGIRGMQSQARSAFLGVDQGDLESPRLFQQMLHQGAAPGRLVGFAEQQLRHLLLFGCLQQGIGDRRAGEGQHLGPQLGGQCQRLLQLGRAASLAVHVDHQPGQLTALGEAVTVAHQG